MDFLISACFGAGVAAFVYSRFGRRVGYSNTQNIYIIVGLSFVFGTAIFYSVIALLMP